MSRHSSTVVTREDLLDCFCREMMYLSDQRIHRIHETAVLMSFQFAGINNESEKLELIDALDNSQDFNRMNAIFQKHVVHPSDTYADYQFIIERACVVFRPYLEVKLGERFGTIQRFSRDFVAQVKRFILFIVCIIQEHIKEAGGNSCLYDYSNLADFLVFCDSEIHTIVAGNPRFR